MATFEWSDGFDAVGWYLDHPEAMGDEWINLDDSDHAEMNDSFNRAMEG
jgi:hypothetical protein